MAGQQSAAGRPEGRALWFRRRSVRITIMAAFVGLLLLTAVPIMGYMHYRNTDALLKLADELMMRHSEAIIEKTTAYLKPAAVMTQMSAHLAGAHRLSLIGNPDLEAYAIAVLQAYPQLAMFNMADEHGNFLMPKKMPDGSIATKTINRDADPPTVTWTYRDRQGNTIRTETTTEVDYDPRVRPWFQGAKSANGTYWTDMYILFTDQIPGITTSYPIHDAAGQTVGVFGLDIELGALSEFLKSLKIGSGSVAFIFNEKDELVAYPDVSRIVREESGKLSPVLVRDIAEPRVTRCFEAYQSSNSPRFIFSNDGIDYIGSVMDFPASFGRAWKIGMVVPEDDFIGSLRSTARYTLLIALAILLTALLLARVLARSISRPITALADEAREIQNFQLDSPINLDSSIKEIQELRDALAGMKVGLSAFRKYVPAALVQQLVHTGEAARLGGQLKELTVFFSDVAGFTSLSESLSPEALMVHLSNYLDEMTRLIAAQHGTVDKYIGDAVMAFWGAPIPQDNHAWLACRAALDCQRRLRELNARWAAEGKVPLNTRIGIHTGDVVVGNIGSSERMNYSVIGDTVNVASRLEGANKVYGTLIIVSQATYEQVADHFLFRPLDRVTVPGKKQDVMIYELLGSRESEIVEKDQVLCQRFAAGLDAYFKRDWQRAMAVLRDLNRAFPEDAPTTLFLERCQMLIETPPPADWDGVSHLDKK